MTTERGGGRGAYDVPQSLIDAMNRAINPQPASGAFRGPQAQVLSAKFMGTDIHGRKVYKVAIKAGGQVTYLTRAWNGSTLTKAAKMQGTPSTPGGSGGSGSSAGEGSGSATLDRAKDGWLTQISQMNLPPEVKSSLLRQIENFRGSPFGLSNMVEQQLSFNVSAAPDEGQIDPLAGLDFGGGFGGGGGFSGPTYVAPDRRVVEDFVTGALVGLIGNVPDDEMVNQFADLYMADHRKNFDNPTQEIDPSQSVKEAIRGTEHYQAIHQLRPESEDERAWVAQRRTAAARGGLDTERQEDFAITQATVGGDLDDVERAAGFAQLRQSGNMRGTQLKDQLRGVTQAMFQGVVR